jgi:diguanylate cyclase (GGDEF)-like protein
LSFNNRIILWFICALLVLAADAGFVYKSFTRFDMQQDNIEHTHKVITELDGIVSRLHDVQAAQYGYVITGQNEDLTPYDVAVSELPGSFTALEALFADNPKQADRLKQLKAQADRQVATAKQVIAAYQKDGPQKAASLIRTGAGNREMETIRLITEEMSASETRLLIRQQAEVDDAAQKTLISGGIGLVVCALILGFVFWLMRMENRRRRMTEDSLQQALAKTKRHADEEAIISGMTNFLQSCRNADEAHDIITRTVHKLLPHTSGGIYLFNNSRNLVEMASHWGDMPEAQNEFTAENCWALRSGRIHVMEPGGVEPACTHFSKPPEAGTVCLPMQAHGDTLGLFLLQSADKACPDDDVLRIARTISEHTSLALSNLKLQQRLLNQSIRDPLTGLFNRRYLEETMKREFSRAERNGQPVAALVLDIDHFKKFNDTQGHDAGDAVLVHFAQVLAKAARKDDVAARYGGEEFVLLLPGATAEMAEKRGNEICAATRAMKVSLGKGQVGAVTVSIGVATFPDSGAKPDQLLTAADEALYDAKHNGRDQVRRAGISTQGKGAKAVGH